MNKKIAMSLMSISAALLVMGGATYAAFSGQATLANNTFASGNADLVISRTAADSGFASSVTGFTGSNLFPGYSENFNFWLNNNSSSDISLNTIAKFVDVSTTFGNSELLQDAMKVSFQCGGDAVAGPYSVNEWEAGQAPVSSNLAKGATTACVMTVTLPTTADNSVAGADVNFDVQFDATQVL